MFLDATPRGGAPGTLYVIEPDLDSLPAGFDAHGMHPVAVLALARTLGTELPRTLVLGCEPAAAEEFTGLSAPVAAALDEAEKLLEEVAAKGEVMRNAIIVIGGLVAVIGRSPRRRCPRSGAT